MAAGSPEQPAPQFSGMNLPPGVQIIKIDDLDIPKAEGPPKPIAEIKMSPGDLQKLGKLVQEEDLATQAAKKASRRRDLFCVDLEKAYALMGKVWRVNFDKRSIEVIGEREMPNVPDNAKDPLPDLRGPV